MSINFDQVGSGNITLKTPGSGNFTLILPTADGTNGQVLATNGSGQLSFISPAGGVTSFSAGTTGFTPSTSTTGAVTLAGTLNVANGGTGLTSVTAGYIPFGNGTSALGTSANLVWNSTNSSLGIGGSPNTGFTLDVINAAPRIRQFASTGTNSSLIQLQNTGGSGYLGVDSSTGTLSGAAYALNVWHNGTYPIVFGTSDTARMRISSTGGVSIGTTTDPGAGSLIVAGVASFSTAVRATVVTNNTLSFDMNAASNFQCTPTAGGALTFTNITSGQTGNIILVNGANYAITAAATTKVSATCLATISATGTYWLSYYSDGTNVYVANTGALA